jgi:5-methylcytosine-specific restriction endonuclease McrA
MARTAECTTCGATVVAGKRGPLPRYCGECVRARQLEASQRWKARNSDHVKTYRDDYYADAANRAASQEKCRRNYAKNREAVAVYRRRLYLERQQATNTARCLAYRRANPGVGAEMVARYRARLLAQFVAPVDVTEVRERSQGRCGICGDYVPVADQSLDHIIPLARGGTHEPANVQLAHRVCNSRKGAKLIPPCT